MQGDAAVQPSVPLVTPTFRYPTQIRNHSKLASADSTTASLGPKENVAGRSVSDPSRRRLAIVSQTVAIGCDWYPDRIDQSLRLLFGTKISVR